MAILFDNYGITYISKSLAKAIGADSVQLERSFLTCEVKVYWEAREGSLWNGSLEKLSGLHTFPEDIEEEELVDALQAIVRLTRATYSQGQKSSNP